MMAATNESSQILTEDDAVSPVAIWRHQANDDDVSSIGTEETDKLEIENDQYLELSLSEHLEWSQAKLQEESSKPTWQLEDIDRRVLVVQPTASKLKSFILHPALYRKLGPLSTVVDFAAVMEVGSEWVQQAADVWGKDRVQRKLAAFVRLGRQCLEAVIEDRFNDLIMKIVPLLDVYVKKSDGINFAVGGLLADNNYCVRGKTDIAYRDENGVCIFKTEFKRSTTFPLGHLWYHSTREVQTFGCIFSTSDRVPTLLLTQSQFKIFVERRNRTGVLTLPAGPDTGSTGTFEFIQILVICLLSARSGPPLAEPESLPMTPKRIRPAAGHLPTHERPSKKTGSVRESKLQPKRLFKGQSSRSTELPQIRIFSKQQVEMFDAQFGPVSDESESEE